MNGILLSPHRVHLKVNKKRVNRHNYCGECESMPKMAVLSRKSGGALEIIAAYQTGSLFETGGASPF
jgi:hypothetical protein